MGALEQIIQNEVDKRLAKSTLISSVPCRVVAVLGNEVYTVELVTSKSRFDLVNYSGSPLSVNESVQVYYRGDTLTSQSGYIGASLTKGGGGSKDVYVIGAKSVGELSNAAKTIAEIAVKALEDTTVTLSFNANIYDGTFILEFYINAEQYDYTVKGQSILGAYNNCQVVLPISLTTGEKSIKIKATGNGTIDDIKVFVWGQGITNGTVTIKEKEGYPPLSYTSFDNSLLDWTIYGNENGVGKLGKNYLKQKATPIPNGCIGTFAGSVAASADILTGYTFNTGNNTKIYGIFSYPDGGDGNVIRPADMGNLMMVEGTTIPSAYDADTNLCKEPIYQGTVYYQDYTNGAVVGTSQMFFVGTDQYGRTNTFIDSYWTDRRTHIGSITVKPNTDYSVRLFGCSYPTMLLGFNAVTEAGTITPTFTRLWNQKTIPTNEAFGDAETATEQWINLAYQYYDYLRSHFPMPIDLRPIRYEFCESFAELKAGTYKLMIDEWGNYDMGSDWIGFSGYSGCYEDNWDGQQTGIYEWFALVKEDNTPVISKTRLFDESQNRGSKTPPYPNYFHKEFTFTLTEDTNVGVIHKAYYNSRTYAYPPYFRFYIVDSDVEAESFTTTGCSPVNMSGYSAWEKYNVTLPVTITSGTQSQTITFDLGDSMLYENDTVSMASTSTTLPSYVGLNMIEVDSDNKPYVYIKYTGL